MRLVLLLSILSSGAQLAPARGLDVLRGGWRQGLVTTGAMLMLAMPLSPALAQKGGGWKEKVPNQEMPLDEDGWREVQARSPAEFRSVMNLQIVTPSHHLIEYLIYLGQDRDDGAVFVTMHSFQTIYALARREIDQDIFYKLQAWDGTVWENVAVDLVHLFPVAELDFYGLSLVRIAGLALHDFTPMQLARFPSHETPINQLSYFAGKAFPSHELGNFDIDPNDDDAVVARGEDKPQDPPPLANAAQPPAVEGENKPPPFSAMSLYWQRCQAGMFDHVTQLGTHNCSSLPGAITQRSVIINSLTGEAVGFYLIRVVPDLAQVAAPKHMVVGFSPEVRVQVEAMLSVSPHDKLPTSWGTLKKVP